MTTLPPYVAPQDWTGRPEDRPGLMWRKAQIQEYLASLQPEDERPTYPDRVLSARRIANMGGGLDQLVALCSPAKLALGVTAKTPRGQLGLGWRWWAWHGFGINGATGAITESLLLRLERQTTLPPRGVLFQWKRPTPDPRLMWALGHVATGVWSHWDPEGWTAVPTVLAQLPAPDWTSELCATWNLGGHLRPDDIPRAVPSARAKEEIRT